MTVIDDDNPDGYDNIITVSDNPGHSNNNVHIFLVYPIVPLRPPGMVCEGFLFLKSVPGVYIHINNKDVCIIFLIMSRPPVVFKRE